MLTDLKVGNHSCQLWEFILDLGNFQTENLWEISVCK